MVPAVMTSRRGFTLIEILIAVMLTGMLTGLALAHVVVTVRRVVDTQEQYSDVSALSRTMSFIARDLYAAMRLSPSVLAVKDHEALGGNDDDILMVMSTAPSVQNMPSGTVVYSIAEGGILHGDILPGLYRWIFPGLSPSDIKTDNLNPEDAQLVLPGVDEFCAEIPSNSRHDDNRKEYTGQLPAGIYIRIGRGVKDNKDDTFRRIERVITFP